MHNKRIVCDIDDTISITTNRDWENAVPKFDVINKLNRLHDEGWEIYLVTARGQVSCNGDSEKAELKYGKQLRDWLRKYEVSYDVLSFHKHLGSYYVDDKALLPSEFVNLEIEILKDGRSGAIVERRGDRVYKTHKTRDEALFEASWYKNAEGIFNIPTLHSVIDKTVCLDYIDQTQAFPSITFFDRLFGILQKIEDQNKVNFKDYLEDIKERHSEVISSLNLSLYQDDLDYKLLDEERSFSHGDLTLDNILSSKSGPVIIDPLPRKTYSSWLNDYSKFLLSLKKYHRETLYSYFLNSLDDKYKNMISLLEYYQWIRIYKYATYEEKLFIESILLGFKNVRSN